MSNYTSKEMKRFMGKAIHSREMIRDGDHVMVAVSGGKDSMSLLWLLRERINRIPIEYRMTAVHVDPGFGADSGGQMEAFFSDHRFDYRVLRSDIGPKAHGPENRENPCFLCSPFFLILFEANSFLMGRFNSLVGIPKLLPIASMRRPGLTVISSRSAASTSARALGERLARRAVLRARALVGPPTLPERAEPRRAEPGETAS